MDNCNSIPSETVTDQSTSPWQYSTQQINGSEDLSAARELLDNDEIVDSSYEETLAAKWWADQIPSGLPYANYLREIYYESFNSERASSVTPNGSESVAADRMQAQRLVYDGLSGTSIGSVSGDPMLESNWVWKDNRAKLPGLGNLSCDETFSVSGLYCFPVPPDTTEDANALWREITAASADCAKLETLAVQTENTIKALSGTFLTSATTIQNNYLTTLNNSLRNITATANDTTINAWNYPITKDSIETTIRDFATAAEATLSANLNTLMELQYAKDECDNTISTAMHELETLVQPTPVTFTTNTDSEQKNQVIVPNPPHDKSSEAATEPAEPLPYEPPEPHVENKINWWLWLMDILITILNKIITTLIANLGIIAPMKAAAAALGSVPPISPGTIDTTAASLPSVLSLAARMRMAAGALATAWFNDTPVLWIYPPLMELYSSVNILASESMSFFDPEPCEFESEAVDFLLDKQTIETAVLASVVNYNKTIRSVFQKNGLSAALTLFNRYHPQ